MKYPFLLYSRKVNHAAIFTELKGDPFVVDLSYKNPLLYQINVRDQKRFQTLLEEQMQPHYTWGVANYLERRDSLLNSCPQMIAENRFFHLGLDVLVPLGTRLHAPLDAVVKDAGYEEGEGNYGGYVLLRHESEYFEAFYSFYGHLSREALPARNENLSAGDVFAAIGDFHENGNWFYHTHIQIITEQGLSDGYVSKGYCAEQDLVNLNDLCPSPVSLFRI